jgi:hypothetical protein
MGDHLVGVHDIGVFMVHVGRSTCRERQKLAMTEQKNLLLRKVSLVAWLQTSHSADKASAAGEIAHSPFPFLA